MRKIKKTVGVCEVIARVVELREEDILTLSWLFPEKVSEKEIVGAFEEKSYRVLYYSKHHIGDVLFEMNIVDFLNMADGDRGFEAIPSYKIAAVPVEEIEEITAMPAEEN